MGAYLRRTLIQRWMLMRINMVSRENKQIEPVEIFFILCDEIFAVIKA